MKQVSINIEYKTLNIEFHCGFKLTAHVGERIESMLFTLARHWCLCHRYVDPRQNEAQPETDLIAWSSMDWHGGNYRSILVGQFKHDLFLWIISTRKLRCFDVILSLAIILIIDLRTQLDFLYLFAICLWLEDQEIGEETALSLLSYGRLILPACTVTVLRA